MIEIHIPGGKHLKLKHLVLDYNGTLAFDGELLPKVKETLIALAPKIDVHVLTADTFGKARDRLDGVPCHVEIIPKDNQDNGKLNYVEKLGADSVISIGNGRNDKLMLKDAALGIAVIQEEGASADTLLAADVICTDIISALELLFNPLRLVATLRI